MSNIAVLDPVKSPGIAMIDCPQGRFQYELSQESPDSGLAKATVLDLASPLYDPGSQGIIFDRSGKNNHGTLSSPTWVRLPSGLWVLDFDGTDDRVTFSNAVSVRGRTIVAFECWFYTNVLDGAAHSLWYESTAALGTTARFYAFINTTNVLVLGGRAPDTDGFTNWVVSAKALSTFTWYHLVAIFNSVTDSHTIYLNANPETATVVEPAFTDSNPNIVPQFGTLSTNSNPWNGRAAKKRLYLDFAPSQADVTNHYDQEKHLFGAN